MSKVTITISDTQYKHPAHAHCGWFIPSPDGEIGGTTCQNEVCHRVTVQEAGEEGEDGREVCPTHLEECVSGMGHAED